MKFSKKKIFLVLLIVSGAALTWRFTQSKAAPVTTDQLSNRAEEFIAAQRSDGAGLWNEVDLENNQQPAATQTTISTECFSLELPLRTINPNSEFSGMRCNWRAKIIEPRGYVAVASYPAAEFENDSGIVLRRRSPEQYSEESLEIPDFSQTLVFRSETEAMVFALHQQQMITLAFTDLSKPSNISNAQITVILSTLQLKPLPKTTLSPTP